jgi:hypothetical protein
VTPRRFEIRTENSRPLPVESGTGEWVRHADAKEQNESHLDLLQDVVTTACGSDSNGVSAYADALRTLAKHGRCRIIKDQGKRVIVEWISAESPTTIGSGS